MASAALLAAPAASASRRALAVAARRSPRRIALAFAVQGAGASNGARERATLAPVSTDPNVAFYQVKALVRPWRLDGVVHALNEAGILGLTTYAVQGAGAQVGSSERYKGTEFTGGAATDALVEKVCIEVVVETAQAQDVVDTIVNAAQTGEIGDGKIFLLPVHDVVRIRTGEVGENAERMAGGRKDMKASA